MRRFLLLLLACVVSPSCLAEVYASASLGWNDTRISCRETHSVLGPNEITSCTTDRLSGVARLGFLDPSGYGVELSLMSFGRAAATSFNTLAEHQFGHSVAPGSYVQTRDTYRSRSAVISVTRTLAVSDASAIELKAGWARTRSQLAVCPVLTIETPVDFCIRPDGSARQALAWGLGFMHKIASIASVVAVDSVPLGRFHGDGLSAATLVPPARDRVLLVTVGVRKTF